MFKLQGFGLLVITISCSVALLLRGNGSGFEPEDSGKVPSSLEIDLGEVAPGTVCTRRFEVQNSTSRSWRVLKIEKACGCTDLALDSKIIGSGQDLRGTVTFNVPKSPGRFRKTAVIQTDDAGALSLGISGVARAPFRIMPEQLVFDCGESSSTVEWELTCEGIGMEGLAVSECPSWCSVTLGPLIDDGRVKRSISKVSVNANESRRGTLSIRDASGYVSTIPISVSTRAVIVSPSLLYFGEVHSGQTSTLEVWLRYASVNPQNVHIESMDDEIRAELHVENETEAKLTAHFQGTQKGHFQCFVTVYVGNRTVRVPVVAKVI